MLIIGTYALAYAIACSL